MSRESLEYKLSWNILLDVFREFIVQEDFIESTVWYEAVAFYTDIRRESLATLITEETPENLKYYPPLDTLLLTNRKAVVRALVDLRESDFFIEFSEAYDRISPDDDDDWIHAIVNEAKKVFKKDLYIKDVPVLPQNEFDEEGILKYVDLYKKGKVPLLFEIIDNAKLNINKPFDFDDFEPKDEPKDENDNEPLNNRRLPIFPTDKDFLPPNILTDPGNLNKQLNERLQQKKFSEYAKAKNIDVPYLIGVDNVNRQYNNNKLQAELRNGTANNKDRINQWHRDKTLYKLDKYGLYKQPIQIKHPFNK